MELTILITICSLLLIAYLFDFTSSRTKIPSVILLLLLGWLVRQVTIFFDLHIPDFSSALPILGTIGLILIVLEGSLELDLNISKVQLIKKTVFGAFVPVIVLAFTLAYLFILLFGLFIRNLDEFKRFKWIDKFRPDEFKKEVKRFNDLTIEGTFLIRALFFLVFGYSIETSELLNTGTMVWALGIVSLIFVFRAIQLKVSKIQLAPLLFVAPRGLITILLFLSIAPTQKIALVTKSLIIQVIVLTALTMMIGLMTTKRVDKKIT